MTDIVLQPATISAGQSLSGPCPVGPLSIVGFAMPGVWTGAGLSFQVTPDGGSTWLEMVDATGAPIAMGAAASEFIMLANPALWRGINMIKVRSGTSAAPVNQAADRIINVMTRAGTQ